MFYKANYDWLFQLDIDEIGCLTIDESVTSCEVDLMEILDSSPESLTQPHQIQMSTDEEYSNDSYPMKYLF